MARAVCALCEEAPNYKMASFYWAWRFPTGDRRAYVQLFDYECSQDHLKRLQAGAGDDNNCTRCGELVETARATGVWCTWYLPGHDRQDAMLLYHDNCLNQDEDLFTHNARRLPNREQGGLGRGAPRPTWGPKPVLVNPWLTST